MVAGDGPFMCVCVYLKKGPKGAAIGKRPPSVGVLGEKKIFFFSFLLFSSVYV